MGQSIGGKTKLVGVIGWPVGHTLSPPMHNAALAALGLDWVYVPMPVRPEDLAAAVAGARALGFVGFNVTIPHKEAVAHLMDEIDPAARAIGAVNTVHFSERGTIGANSDAYGYTRTVQAEGAFDFQGKTILQIGAGGAGRAMAAGAAQAGAARVMILNRNAGRGRELVESLRGHFPGTMFEFIAEGGEADAAAEADMISNATSLGMKEGDPLPLAGQLIAPRHIVFDTVYRPSAETPFLKAAARRGAHGIGGLGMLARQGAWSLRLWTRGAVDAEPDEALMMEVLQRSIAL